MDAAHNGRSIKFTPIESTPYHAKICRLNLPAVLCNEIDLEGLNRFDSHGVFALGKYLNNVKNCAKMPEDAVKSRNNAGPQYNGSARVNPAGMAQPCRIALLLSTCRPPTLLPAHAAAQHEALFGVCAAAFAMFALYL